MHQFIIVSAVLMALSGNASAANPLQSSVPQSGRCNVLVALQEAQRQVVKIPFSNSGTSTYYETYVGANGSTHRRTRRDYNTRMLPLVLLNLQTCQLERTMVTRQIEKGTVPSFLVSDDGKFLIAVEERVYGNLWNWWNTPFEIIAPKGWVVAAIHWKRYPSHKEVVYTPFSTALLAAFPELIELGYLHLSRDVEVAFDRLQQVPSRLDPTRTVSDIIRTHLPELPTLIIKIEHADDHEVQAHAEGRVPYNPLERPIAIFGANGDRAYAATESKAGALRSTQVMPQTCQEVRSLYRDAQLPPGCTASNHGHSVELAAAMLVIDYHLSIIYHALGGGEEFLQRPDLSHLALAAYNGGPGRVIREVRQGNGLVRETHGYLDKATHAVSSDR